MDIVTSEVRTLVGNLMYLTRTRLNHSGKGTRDHKYFGRFKIELLAIAYDTHFALPILDPAHYTFENKEYIVVPNDEKRDVEYT